MLQKSARGQARSTYQRSWQLEREQFVASGGSPNESGAEEY